MPDRIYVNYQQPMSTEQPDSMQVILMRTFEGLGYDLYMVHDKTNMETGIPERTLEFWRRF